MTDGVPRSRKQIINNVFNSGLNNHNNIKKTSRYIYSIITQLRKEGHKKLSIDLTKSDIQKHDKGGGGKMNNQIKTINTVNVEKNSNEYSRVCGVVRDALEEMFPGANERIPRIKKIREVSAMGLRDAKEFVEGKDNL